MFTEAETEEIHHLKKLTLSVMEKSPEIVTEPIVCQAIQKSQKSALDSKNVSTEAVAAGVVRAAELVCTKSLKKRFAGVLMGACINLVGC